MSEATAIAAITAQTAIHNLNLLSYHFNFSSLIVA